MKLRTFLLGCLVASSVGLMAGPAAAERVVEVFRSPTGPTGSVSVNPTDGSCWVAKGNNVLHLAADGRYLSIVGGFSGPGSVSVNPSDGSCWVADTGHNQVVHLADGKVVITHAGNTVAQHPLRV